MSTDSVSVLPWPKLKAKRAAAGPRLIDSVSGLSGGVFPSVSGLSGSVFPRHNGYILKAKRSAAGSGLRFTLSVVCFEITNSRFLSTSTIAMVCKAETTRFTSFSGSCVDLAILPKIAPQPQWRGRQSRVADMTESQGQGVPGGS